MDRFITHFRVKSTKTGATASGALSKTSLLKLAIQHRDNAPDQHRLRVPGLEHTQKRIWWALVNNLDFLGYGFVVEGLTLEQFEAHTKAKRNTARTQTQELSA